MRRKEEKGRRRRTAVIKNSFLGQRDDSAFATRVGGAAGQSERVAAPRVYLPGPGHATENIESCIGAGIYTLTQDISGRQVFLDARRRTCHRNNIVRLDIHIRP